MGGNILILSEQTIDQIAAGEVIENPASVVKEIFENAVDAGSSRIVVEISGGGFQSIRISDDGCGMSEEDALLCLKRHATSKIRCTDDLLKLHTMGFRGEALASIAAISAMTLTTSLADHLGTQVSIKGGEIVSVEPSARPQGTLIEVRSLFYNVPARKKFQKSAAASSAEITRVVTLLALAHPYIGVELIQQKKTVFSLPAAKETDAVIPLLEKRSGDLLGTHFQSHMHYLSFQENGYEMHGLIGDPGSTRYNRSGQYLFINARPVHCLPAAFAIRDGYGTRVDTTRHPIYVIHAKIEPSLIDVNVHPQKKEVRLREEERMKQMMRTAVSKALQKKEIPLDLEIDIPSFLLYHNRRAGGNLGCVKDPGFNDNKGVNINSNMDPFIIVEPQELSRGPNSHLLSDCGMCETREEAFVFPERRNSLPFALEEQMHFLLQEDIKPIGLFEHYLIVSAHSIPCFLASKEVLSGLAWIDLRAAEARILFEQLLSPQSKMASQGLLLPITFSCSKAEGEKLLSCTNELEELGIELREVGPCVFMVEAIPSFLEEKEVHPILQALAAAVLEENHQNRKKQCAQTICRLSRSRLRPFSLDEGLKIVKELGKAVDPLYCPRGKPIFYHMKKDEIEKQFQ